MTTYTKAIEKGSIVNKKSWHNPNSRGFMQSCGCKTKQGNKGTYRDITVELDGNTLHFYHQTLIVKKSGQMYTLNNGGYKTSTTKERINRYLPSPWYVKQVDFDWYLINRKSGQKYDFVNGMTVNVANNEVLD